MVVLCLLTGGGLVSIFSRVGGIWGEGEEEEKNRAEICVSKYGDRV